MIRGFRGPGRGPDSGLPVIFRTLAPVTDGCLAYEVPLALRRLSFLMSLMIRYIIAVTSLWLGAASAGADLAVTSIRGGGGGGLGGCCPGRGGAGFGGQGSGAAEEHGYGQEDEAVGESTDGDLVSRHPAAELGAEDVAGAVGEVDAAGRDGDPDCGIRQAGPGHRPAGLAVVGDADQRRGEDAEGQAGRRAGDLNCQPAAGGSGALEEERDDDGRGDDRAQQPHRADLAAAEVGGQHHGKDGEVEDPDAGVHSDSLVSY